MAIGKPKLSLQELTDSLASGLKNSAQQPEALGKPIYKHRWGSAAANALR